MSGLVADESKAYFVSRDTRSNAKGGGSPAMVLSPMSRLSKNTEHARDLHADASAYYFVDDHRRLLKLAK